MINKSSLVYGRGSKEFHVTIGAPDARGYGHGGFEQTLRVRADHWRAAKRYVEKFDPFRLWNDYAAVLARCKGEPYVSRVFDNGRVYFKIDSNLPVGGIDIVCGDRYDQPAYSEEESW